jgi:hypothetical protein
VQGGGNSQLQKAEIFYKGGVPFVHLPIPPTYGIKVFALHPEMTFESLVEAIKIEQSDIDITITNSETGE